MGQRLFIGALLAVVAGFLPRTDVSAATPLTSLTIRLTDLRPGYTAVENSYRTPSNIAAKDPVGARMLLAHGWTDGYDSRYQRGQAASSQVGQIVDRFRTEAGAHWGYDSDLLRVAPDYHTVAMTRVGNESTAVQSRSYVGIIFRHGTAVVDLYVSLGVTSPQVAVLALSRLVDRRLLAEPLTLPRSRPVMSALSFTVWIRPGTMTAGTYATVYVKTSPGAFCSVRVVYADRHVAFSGYPRYTGRDGVTWWSWHAVTRSRGGTASVTCTSGRTSKTVGTQFTIRR